MGRLTYGMIVSLDGYVRDAGGSIDWTEPDPRLHEHFNRVQRDTAVDVYGAGMWASMRYWQDPPAADLEAATYRDFARAWRETPSVVVSRSLTEDDTAGAELWPDLDLDRLRALVAATDGDVSISGPTLAAQALRAGLVDEVSAHVVPRVVGGGLRFLPEDYGARLRLREHETFPGGVVRLTYALVPGEGSPA